MDITMAEWTRQELETLYPDGTVSVQVDDTVTVMTTDEWSAWIDSQVGTEKPEEEVLP
jgi:trans-2-enoyl-CoA reductase